MPPRAAAPAPDVEEAEPAGAELPEAEPAAAAKGRGGARKPAASAKAARKIKGRTIYLPDDLFERILVQAHRRDKTISEYVTAILERQVPDYRTSRAGEAGDSDAA